MKQWGFSQLAVCLQLGGALLLLVQPAQAMPSPSMAQEAKVSADKLTRSIRADHRRAVQRDLHLISHLHRTHTDVKPKPRVVARSEQINVGRAGTMLAACAQGFLNSGRRQVFFAAVAVHCRIGSAGVREGVNQLITQRNALSKQEAEVRHRAEAAQVRGNPEAARLQEEADRLKQGVEHLTDQMAPWLSLLMQRDSS